ncbi:MAG: 3-alpha,7-alpha,12-alpha-trihydroxy-5-beta-cholest-24-enoyl-CoA hydratase [Alphaproteobacteria bacterium HGW-Alphaproteobacteria-16]|nr:MAG: 3-alpha,7-alpha,12-alpha-trihydroxy-5-beta-cholest-24-enoyl-CoA hydratase [Alphaproteobacteria bacterium HGW-Alphaproteobacteria-16]
MPLDADYIQARTFEPVETVITDRDVMFYALSIGLGRDPLDMHDLRYVFERDLRVFPTMPIVVGHPGNWMSDPATGITRTMVVHGAQQLSSFGELPVGGTVVTTNRVSDIWDKGDKGAVLDLVRETFDKATGDLIARSKSSVFCRADGGFGGPQGESHVFQPVPEREADRSVAMPTEPSMALLYRLNNDRNPLHAEPAFAAKAGFARPILHGLATYGLAAVAVAKAFPDRTIGSFEARFSRPVLPGETVAVDIWNAPDGVAFRARVGDKVVLDRGRATLV